MTAARESSIISRLSLRSITLKYFNMNAKKEVPVLLLTGYLGSGKTTLLNKILANEKGIKFAVIVNDIGEVNIDAALIEKGGSAERLHLLHAEDGPYRPVARHHQHEALRLYRHRGEWHLRTRTDCADYQFDGDTRSAVYHQRHTAS